MAQIFHPSLNVISKVSIVAGAMLAVGTVGLLLWLGRSHYVTNKNVARPQPVPFSHKHHVSGLGLDCRNCHVTVEEGGFAGIPPSKTCMSCHSQIWNDAPMLETVRMSYANDESVPWTRVHDLPDFVYFNHSIHVNKGIGCATCHGRVDQMPLMWRENTLQMNWCWDCHNHPEQHLRPREEIFNMAWEPPDNHVELAAKLAEEYNVRRATDCSVCHR